MCAGLCVQRQSEKGKVKSDCLLVQSIKLHPIHILSFELSWAALSCIVLSLTVSGIHMCMQLRRVHFKWQKTYETRFFCSYSPHALDISLKRFNPDHICICTSYMRKLFSIFAALSMQSKSSGGERRTYTSKNETTFNKQRAQHSTNNKLCKLSSVELSLWWFNSSVSVLIYCNIEFAILLCCCVQHELIIMLLCSRFFFRICVPELNWCL